MRKCFLFLTLLLGLNCVMAAPVNSRTALRVAENFWRSISSDFGKIEQVADASFSHMYIFHVNETEGFVIVAADDRAYPILAYGTDNVAGNMGPETRFWLGQYEREIEALASGTVRNDDAILADYIAREWSSLLSGTWSEPKSGNMVPAMLTTRWNQSPYYDYYCPTGCPAGCVATAMAQVMKYWNHPIKGTGYHGYHTVYGYLSANFDSTYYDWDHMPNSLSSSSSMEEVHAVAEISYHAGIAVEMEYTTDGSGASLVGYGYGASGLSALKNFFGYSNTAHGAYKSEYTDAEWVATLKADIDLGHPILYAGYDNSAGHAFVFDGYNSSSQFHVNWGWGGAYNGFYSMGALNPGGGGVGTNTSNTFNSTNQCILGLEPQNRLGIQNTSELLFPVNGDLRTLAFTSSHGNPSNWTATSSDPWLTINPSTGDGNGAVTSVSVRAYPNTNNPLTDRYATITLVQDSETVVIPVYQMHCEEADLCTLTVNAYDSRNNGWNSCFLTLESTTGTIYGTMTLADGSYGIREYSVCPDTVLAIWHHGSSDADCGYFIENSNGIVLLNHEAGSPIDDTVLIVNPCTNTGGVGPIRYAVTATVNDTNRGYVDGITDEASFGESLTLTAYANAGSRFVKWNDGMVTNPRTLTIVADRSLNARFADLGTDTLHYDNGTYKSAFGDEEGTHWAIRFPASELVGHTTLSSVKFYNIRSGYYTLNIHQGEVPKRNNLVSSTYFYQSRQTRYRWVEKVLDTAVVLDHSKPLWITLYNDDADVPATVAAWSGNDDGSWYTSDGANWHPLSHWGIYASWMMRAYMPVDPNEYTLTVTTNNRRWGTVTGGGIYRYGQAATLVATPSEGYHFERWNDDNSTDNPRTIYVTDNKIIRAIFAEGEVGIEDASTDNVVLYVEGHNLFVRGADGHKLSVYDALGRCIYHADSHQALSIMLPAAGVYVVRLDDNTMRKVVATK